MKKISNERKKTLTFEPCKQVLLSNEFLGTKSWKKASFLGAGGIVGQNGGSDDPPVDGNTGAAIPKPYLEWDGESREYFTKENWKNLKKDAHHLTSFEKKLIFNEAVRIYGIAWYYLTYPAYNFSPSSDIHIIKDTSLTPAQKTIILHYKNK